MDSNETRVLLLRDYIAILRSHAVLMAVCLIAAIALAVAASLLATPQYRAEARVRVEPAASNLTGDTPANVSSNIRDRNLQNEVDFAESDRVAARAENDFGEQVEVEVSAAGASDKLLFTAADADPARAASMANTWADAYVTERSEASGERYLNSRTVIDSRLTEISEQRVQLEAESSSAADSGQIVSQLAALDRAEQGLRSQLNELDVLIELNQTGSVSVLNSAIEPESPFSPNWPLNLLLGLIGGGLLGAALSLLINTLDNTIRDSDDMRSALSGAPVLTTVPPQKFGEGQIMSAIFDEAFRALQLSIDFGTGHGVCGRSS